MAQRRPRRLCRRHESLRTYIGVNGRDPSGPDTSYLAFLEKDFFITKGLTWTGNKANDYVIQPVWSGIKATPGVLYSGSKYVPVAGSIIQGVEDYYTEEINKVSLITVKGGVLQKRILLWEPSKGSQALKTALTGYDHIENVWLNGQSNGLEKSINISKDGHVLGGQDGTYILIHNDTSGALADTTQSAFGKFGSGSKVAEQVSVLLASRGKRNIKTKFTVHSQGGIMGTNALNKMAKQGITNWSNLTVRHHGSASHYSVAKSAQRAVGGKWGGMVSHPGDLVPQVIGLNGGWESVYTIPYSIIKAPTLFIDPNVKYFGSEHTLYYPYEKGE